MPRGFSSLAPLAARAADNKKGEDILLLDLRRRPALGDFMLLVNINSPAHLEAVEREIEKTMEAAGVVRLHRDGSDSALWRVLDYGGLLVHLMHPEARAFYGLDKLYHDVPRRQWEPGAPAKAKSPPARRKSRRTVSGRRAS